MKFDERNPICFQNPLFVSMEYHIPCEVVLLRFDIFKMAAIAMEMPKMLKT
jgi:hypothetical protein